MFVGIRLHLFGWYESKQVNIVQKCVAPTVREPADTLSMAELTRVLQCRANTTQLLTLSPLNGSQNELDDVQL